MKLLIASNNQHKIEEIKQVLKKENISVELVSPKEIGLTNFDVIEDKFTLDGNAEKKAIEFYNETGITCFADDTGLEVDALNGEPGVYSARYAGENCSYDDNCNKLLSEMDNKANRNAQFRTVICFYDGKQPHFVEGVCRGEITKEKFGTGGFGYDPVFRPENYEITFAEMGNEEKNKISHRGLAVIEFAKFLKDYINGN